MLRMKRDDLARKAEVAVATLADFEAGRRNPHPRTLVAIRLALEAAGVAFISENGEGVGVRMKRSVDSIHEELFGRPRTEEERQRYRPLNETPQCKPSRANVTSTSKQNEEQDT
ncbi:helix-turn-helix domain-containing protein [Gluconacetobacter johannae]|nr:helix-turn-helix transcriptional regulator [Gluconacetobacter johannae]